MLKIFLTLFLLIVLVQVNVRPALAVSLNGQQQTSVQDIKARVAKRGVGKKAKVNVKLRDGSMLKGYISEADDDSFTLTDKTGQTRTLAYVDVSEVKKPGGLSLGAKIGIGVGAVVGTLAVLYLIACGSDPFC